MTEPLKSSELVGTKTNYKNIKQQNVLATPQCRLSFHFRLREKNKTKIFGSLVVSLLPPANVYTRDKFRISAKSCISRTPFPFSSKPISLQNSSHWKTKPLNNICHPTTPFAAPKNKSVQNVSPYINRSIFLLSFISSPKQPFLRWISHIPSKKQKSQGWQEFQIWTFF